MISEAWCDMRIIPAIDLIGGRAVRLTQGDYARQTVYDDDPLAVARRFAADGAEWLHVVDLEGARDGNTPNIETVARIARSSGLKVELGGGIRSADTAKRYLDVGVERVILGTVAATSPDILSDCLEACGGRVAVGVDLRGETVAIKGWLESAPIKRDSFIGMLTDMGVRDLIVTDISRDGAMKGTNIELYEQLCRSFEGCNIIASGGVSSYSDIAALARLGGLWGAIIGKACYTGAIDLKKAIETAGAYQ